MNLYQRKTLVIILSINLIFGLQQYLLNQAVVFPSPINSIVFLFATIFFLFKTILNSTRLEKLVMLLFLLSAFIQFASDSFVLEIPFANQHQSVSEWVNSSFFYMTQILGAMLLLSTLLILAFELRKIKVTYFYITLVLFITLVILAFFKIPLEPLIVLGLTCGFLQFVLIKHNEALLAGISAAMHLWIIYFANEMFEYWNLML